MSGKTVKLKRNSFSIRRSVVLYASVSAIFFFFWQMTSHAATSTSQPEIEWLKQNWRVESLNVEEAVSYRQWTRTMIAKYSWMKVDLEKAAEQGNSLSVSPDGSIYFITSSDEVDPQSSACVYRMMPGWLAPRKFAVGLRQPLPIVFDAHGNPFVMDAGLGDPGKSRWLHLIEQTDYGWRSHLESEGVFSDKASDGESRRSANTMLPFGYIMPSIALMPYEVTDVIAGADTGWSSDLPQVFYMIGGRGGVRQLESFISSPAGITFQLNRKHSMARSRLSLFAGQGTESSLSLIQHRPNDEGADQRMGYRFFDPKFEHTPESSRTRQILEADPVLQATPALIQWLDHSDRRIRMLAQFALADRGKRALGALIQRAKNPFQTIGRLHALWAIRLMLHHQPEPLANLSLDTWEKSLLADPAPNVRSVALELYAMLGGPHRERLLIEALSDGHAVVRLQAVRLLGMSASTDSKKWVLDWMVQAENQAYVLQHAGMIALSTLMSTEELVNLASHADDSVRTAALLGLRRKKHAGVQEFLDDANPFIMLEAAQAIMDEPIPDALPSLADMHGSRTDWLPAFAFRDQQFSEWSSAESMQLCVYRANAMLQQPNHIQSLAEAAEFPGAGEEIRKRVSEWLLGWLRDKAMKDGAWDEVLEDLWLDRAESWIKADLEMQRRLMLEMIRFREWKHHASLVERIFRGYNERHENRALALKTLADWRVSGLSTLIGEALRSNSALLRKEAVLIQAELNPSDEVAGWVRLLESGGLGERQKALQFLGPSRDRRVDSVLLYWLEAALAGEMSPGLHQGLIEAAQLRTPPVIKQKLADLKSKLKK